MKLPTKEESELRTGARAVAECIVAGLKNKRSRVHYTIEVIAELIEAQVRAGIGRERDRIKSKAPAAAQRGEEPSR